MLISLLTIGVALTSVFLFGRSKKIDPLANVTLQGYARKGAMFSLSNPGTLPVTSRPWFNFRRWRQSVFEN